MSAPRPRAEIRHQPASSARPDSSSASRSGSLESDESPRSAWIRGSVGQTVRSDLDAATLENIATRVAETVDDLAQETGLAHTGFARDKDDG